MFEPATPPLLTITLPSPGCCRMSACTVAHRRSFSLCQTWQGVVCSSINNFSPTSSNLLPSSITLHHRNTFCHLRTVFQPSTSCQDCLCRPQNTFQRARSRPPHLRHPSHKYPPESAFFESLKLWTAFDRQGDALTLFLQGHHHGVKFR